MDDENLTFGLPGPLIADIIDVDALTGKEKDILVTSLTLLIDRRALRLLWKNEYTVQALTEKTYVANIEFVYTSP